MMDYVMVKWLHILSSTFLFGTGIGSTFYMFFGTLNRDPKVVFVIVKNVVVADWLFTATSAVFQPISGYHLAHLAGMPFTSRWIVASTVLYVVAGACWLPVVWMQIRMRDLARDAAESGLELPPLYWRYFRIWI